LLLATPQHVEYVANSLFLVRQHVFVISFLLSVTVSKYFLSMCTCEKLNLKNDANWASWTVITKFHYTGSTGPDQTRVSNKVRGLCLLQSGQVGPV